MGAKSYPKPLTKRVEFIAVDVVHHSRKLTLGDIYKTSFDERPFRVIGFDDFEVFYDCLWSDNSWTFSGNFKGNVAFYRMSRDLFISRSKLIGHEELTDEERFYFRPELPMRFGRTRKVNWNSFNSKIIDSLKREFSSQIIPIQNIFLVPLSEKGGYKKGHILENKKEMSVFDIIKIAKEIQESVNGTESNGIGFYRLGYAKGLPSYAIGEYKDQAGILE